MFLKQLLNNAYFRFKLRKKKRKLLDCDNKKFDNQIRKKKKKNHYINKNKIRIRNRNN